MLEQRVLDLFEEMVGIHSPSRQEGRMAAYVEKFLRNLGAEIYLDHVEELYGGDAPVIFAHFKGDLPGDGVTLNGHMDVIQPNENVHIIKEKTCWKTDGTTTLGGDDKAGLAAILTAVEYVITEQVPHRDLYLIITTGEEEGLLGARNIHWEEVYRHLQPAKNMIVVDNAGGTDTIAYQAPTGYTFQVTIKGKKAHAGIEPEKGISAIQEAAKVIAQMPLLRLDPTTTANIGDILTEGPSNVVPDLCTFNGEIRAQTDERAQEVLANYRRIIEEVCGDRGVLEECLDYPALSSRDDLAFIKEVSKSYQQLGVKPEPQIIGGGSDANWFAEEGFNAAIVGVGMHLVHTTEEYLEFKEMQITTKALIDYLTVLR